VGVYRVGLPTETTLTATPSAARSGDEGAAWTLLEGADVLSQPWAWPHVKVHAAMPALGWRTRPSREYAPFPGSDKTAGAIASTALIVAI
jgi:hypothetical protein